MAGSQCETTTRARIRRTGIASGTDRDDGHVDGTQRLLSLSSKRQGQAMDDSMKVITRAVDWCQTPEGC